MNPSIAAASLLGFGDKPASEALQGFSTTLGKLYETQSQKIKTDEKSRKSVLDEYNKSQRTKKRKEADFAEFLKNMKGKNEGNNGTGSGNQGSIGGGILGKLGLAALAIMGPSIIGNLIFEGIKGTIMSFANPIIDKMNEVLQPVYDFVKGIGEKAGGLLEAGSEAFNDIIDDIKEFFGITPKEEMAYFGDDYKEQELALARAAEESRNKTPAEGVSEAVKPTEKEESTTPEEKEEPTAPQQGGNTAWSPVLEMISSAESRGRYDIMYGGEIVDGITEMTIAEAAKRAGDRGDGKNYAVGKYQFITLVKQAEAAGLDPNKDLFSPKNQDKIAIDLIVRKRGVTIQMAKNNPKEAGKRLAMEWAGLPVLAPTKGHKRDIQRGQSYYAGDGINKSTITPEQVEASFQKLQKGGSVNGEKTQSTNKFHEKLFEKIENRKENQKQREPRKGNGAESEQGMASIEFVQKKQKGGKIFLHWAGTPHSGYASEKYHATIMRDGTPKQRIDYNKFVGEHTSGRNSEGVGISLDAMGQFNGKWPDFGDFGPFAVKPAQYEGMADLSAQILKDWGKDASYVTKNNVQTHAEAANIGDSQGGYGPQTTSPIPEGDYRWDLWGLYENDTPGSGGNKIRNMIRAKMGGKSKKDQGESEETSSTSSSNSSTSSSDSSTPSSDSPSTSSIESLIRPPGVVPSAPSLDVPEVKSMEELTLELGRQMIAPLFGFLGALTGKPLKETNDESDSKSDGGNETPTPFGGGASGAASITNPNAKALLNAIADAEGTSQYPEQGYRTMFTGKQFSGKWKHPKQIQSSSGYSSDAAGRYQFLSTTWKEMGMADFSPANQDRAALKLVSQSGVNINDGLSEQEIYKVGQKWASVEGGPTATKGGSYGAQAKYSAGQFMQMYKGYGGEPQKLQQGGTVGRQINSGTMKGSINTQMTRLREASEKTRKRRGPKIITVPMPPTPAPQVIGSGEGEGMLLSQGVTGLTCSALADSNRRLAMGATG